MTEYQLLYLRFLRMKEEFPELNHRGHEPVPSWESVSNGVEHHACAEEYLHWDQRRRAELEFYRPMERDEPVHTPEQWARWYERAVVIAQRSDADRLELVKKLVAQLSNWRRRALAAEDTIAGALV